MRFRIYLILCALTVQSCDPYSFGYVCNNTNDEITLTMKFDYEKNYRNVSKLNYLERLPSQFDGNLNLVELDTAKMLGRYKIEKGRCAQVGHGVGRYPPLWFYELTVATTKDTIVYRGRDKFDKRDEGFKIGFGGKYDLVVK